MTVIATCSDTTTPKIFGRWKYRRTSGRSPPPHSPAISRRNGLRWQFLARLLRHHVRGVPVGPVRVALSGAFLVLAMGGLRTPKRTRQVRLGCECRPCRVDPAGQPRRDLLKQPAVAVRIPERGE